jgi:CHAT domain-containing protein/Tfp pilus assembly protein PilF
MRYRVSLFYSPLGRVSRSRGRAWRTLALLTSFALAIAAHAQQPASLAGTTATTSSSSTSREGGGKINLELGKSIARSLAGGETHSYTIALKAGEFVNIAAVQNQCRVVLTLRSPEGKTLTEVAGSPTTWGAARVLYIAETPGIYLLDVRPHDKLAPVGRYEVAVGELRSPTPQDLAQVAAEKVYAEAYQLAANEKAEARRQAVKKYEEALTLFSAIKEPRGEARTLASLGTLLPYLGDSRRSLDYDIQVLPLWRALGDRAEEAYTLSEMADNYNNLGDPQKALEFYSQALPLRRAVKDVGGEADTLNGIGEVYSVTGEQQKAIDYYMQALPIRRAAGDARGEAITLGDLGAAHSFLGDTIKAIDYYTRALPLDRAAGDRDGEANTLSNLGYIYNSIGESRLALEYLSHALTLARTTGNRALEATTLNMLGGVYSTLGDRTRALDLYKSAAQIRHEVSDPRGEGVSLTNIGYIYHQEGDYRQAIEYYNRSLALSRAVKNRITESLTLSSIGNAYYALHDSPRALQYHEEALVIARAIKSRIAEARILNNLGVVHRDAGEWTRAIETFNEALSLNRDLNNRWQESATLYHLALLEAARGNLDEALARVEAALAVVESLRTNVPSQNLRSSYLATVQDYFNLRTDLLMRLHKEHPEAGYDSRALHAAEQARARSLLELLKESAANIKQGVEPALLERERLLRQSLAAKADSQSRLLNGKRTPEQEAAVARELKDLSDDYEQVRAEIRAHSPRYAALTQPSALTVKELQGEILDEETLLLEYSLGEERSYLWVIGRHSLTSYELPKRAVIEGAARQVYEGLTARNQSPADEADEQKRRAGALKAESAYPEAAARLSQMLLAPAAQHLGTKRLLIVADGPLQYIPFGALFQPVTNVAGSESRYTPIVVAHEIVMLPSASTLAVLRREAEARRSETRTASAKTIAVLADPVFNPNDPRVRLKESVAHVKVSTETSTAESQQKVSVEGTRAATSAQDVERSAGESGVNAFARLRFSREEAESIKQAAASAGAMEIVDFDANKKVATSAAFGNHRIIHFATHGLINSVNPELSGVVLSLVDASGQPEDGFLRLYDIYNLPLETDLVVLSACQTALGREVRGEGLIGLTRGFMYAGAPRVVASLWRIDDRATAELMRRFYTKMLRADKPLRPAAALREAQVEMWRSERWRSPYYWAAFTIQGEWK